MSTGIFVIRENDRLLEMEERAYETEDVFQALLAEHPGIIPGSQIDSANPRRWLLICREAAIPGEEDAGGRWSLDHLLVDQDAIPTLVEVKRSEDTRIRREVVGQMLEYAANASAYWSVETVRAWFDAKCSADRIDADARLREFLDEDRDVEDFWATLEANLDAGNLRLVFLADRIPAELQTIVEFLNHQMQHMEVLAVEVKRYGREDTTALVSRVLGQTAAKRSDRESRKWDETAFFAELQQRRGMPAVSVARRLFRWSEQCTSYVWFGNGKSDGSFFPIVKTGDITHTFIAVWTYGKVEVQFQHMTNPPSDDMGLRLELLDRLNEIPGVSIPGDAIERRPSFPLSALAEEAQLTQFLAIMDWWVSKLRQDTGHNDREDA